MEKWVQAYERYLSEDRSVSGNTRLGYSRDLRHFSDAMEAQGLKTPQDLQPFHIQAYLNRLRQEGKSAATLARRLVSVRGLCKFGIIERYIDRDPTLQLEIPKPERKAPRVLTLAEVEKLLDAPEASTPQGLRDKAMLELLYGTGLRVSELMALDVADVHLEMGFLQCSAGSGRERIVPVGGASVHWLREYLKQARPVLAKNERSGSILFPNHLGTRMTRQGFWKIVKKYASESGISSELTPHSLRHSFAVHLLDNGADVRAVQEMLGHASPQTTQKYEPSVRSKVKEVYDRTHPRARS
ncbi:tyrosine recombinase XerD [Cohnella pontilimi]|uniref:Tyrosine recombinase XerC n=1 Tax=Cohnella pontilimi TaxID=2564100 RepID=A0A4V5LSU4_9BACL|nr:site-specific tyrosine recombinase [Cohnella pontilimi]TJY44409.1 tyrosine recombinase XerD [Cohnella pontilimi]